MARPVRLGLLRDPDWLRWRGAHGTDPNSFTYNGSLRHCDTDADARHLHRPALLHPNPHALGDADSHLRVRLLGTADTSLPLMI